MYTTIVVLLWGDYSDVYTIFANTTWPKEEEEQKNRLLVVNQLRRSSVVLSVRFLLGHLDASRPPFHNLLATEAENLITVSAGPGRACRVIYRPSVSSGCPLPATVTLLDEQPLPIYATCHGSDALFTSLNLRRLLTPDWSLQNLNLKVWFVWFSAIRPLCFLHE